MQAPLLLALSLALAQSCGSKPADPPAANASTPPTAKISPEAAQTAALARVPGKIREQELEQEHGRLVYSFEIQPDPPGSPLKEVLVDANDGSIVAVEDEEADEHDRDDDKDDNDDRDADDPKK